MKSTRPKIIHLLRSLIFVCIPLLLCTSAPASDRQIQLEALRNRIQILQSELVAHENTKQDTTDSLQKIEQSISNIHRKLVELRTEKQEINTALKHATTQYKRLKKVLEKENEQLEIFLFQQYTKNEQNYLHILLKLDDPNQIARNMYYLQQLSKSSNKTINSLRDNLNQLQTLTQSIQDKKAKIATIESQYNEQNQKLEQEKSEHKTILSRISEEIAQRQNAIDKLTQDEHRISELIDGINNLFKQENNETILLNNRLPDSTHQHSAFHTLKGKLNLPVRGKLINRFGSQRSGKHVTWKGLFISSPAGSEIKAIATGQVVFADWLRGFGNLMIIDHSQDYISLYGNTEALLKQVGDIVHGGDTIATVGNSGGNPNTGLYFELRYRGKAFDPLTWIKIE